MARSPHHLSVPLSLGLALVACTELNTSDSRRDAATADVDPCGGPCSLGRTCQAGQCTAAVCASGRGDCDRDEASGCERDLATDAVHCGACGNSCALPRATSICVQGVCRVGACDELRGDCDGAPGNGCERDLAADPAHCGRCGGACVVPHATATCAMGACAMGACDPGFADCDRDPNDGCEAELAVSTAHCGGCDTPCPAPDRGVASCVAGVCASACTASSERSTGACLPLGAPRLVAPLSTGVVGSHRPSLRWVLGTGSDGARVTLCRDRAMSAECQSHDATGASLRVPDALARGVWFWRARGQRGATALSAESATWSFVVGARDAATETPPTPSKDLDGDGFDDVAIGASHVDRGTTEEVGAVSVFGGSAAGLSATPSRVLTGTLYRDGLGTSSAIAGDLDGDGFGDLVAGAPYVMTAPTTQPGTVRVFRGGASGVGGAPVVLRGPTGYGGAVTSVGDVDGDGFGDLAITGAVREGGDPVVSVHRGGASGLVTTAWQVLRRDVPTGVAGASDLDRDGFADVLVGAAFTDPGGRADAGAASVYFGSAAGLEATPALRLEGATAGDRAGFSVAMLGDTDGDGFEDFALGAPGARGGAGEVRVYAGSGRSATLARVLAGEAGDAAGTAVARLGDVNGDGYADLAVGAPGARGGRGQVSVFLGGPAGIGETAVRVWGGDATGTGLGAVITGLGDVNGDGYADLAVGERGAPAHMNENVGRVRVFVGAATGPGAAAAWVLEGVRRSDFFGTSVASAGRVASARRGS